MRPWPASRGWSVTRVSRRSATCRVAFGPCLGHRPGYSKARFKESSPTELGRGLAMRQLPARPRVMAGVAVRVVLEVVLMLGLGLPERAGLADLGHDLAGPEA